MSSLTLEVIEGPDAGRQVPLTGPLDIGRDPTAALVLADPQVSRHHVRVTPQGDGAVVEDLGSSNGTFVNHNELHRAVAIDPGDELLVGVSVLTLRSPQQVAAQPSAVRPVPPAFAIPEQRPTFTDIRNPKAVERKPAAAGTGELGAGEYGRLDRYVDANVKLRAKLAPLAMFLLVALVVVVYLGTR